jgi:hypothetical protein
MPDYREWIRQGLERTGKRQVDLAQLLDVSEAVISKMLRDGGTRTFKAEEIARIADFRGEPTPIINNTTTADIDALHAQNTEQSGRELERLRLDIEIAAP